MSTPQPEWLFVSNLGDVDPINHGGYFIYVDANGIYEPEAERLDPPNEDPEKEDVAAWLVHRFTIEDMWWTGGILSDNQFHLDSPAWFARPYNPERRQDGPGGLEELSSFISATPEELRDMFLSPNLLMRAEAWRLVGDYHGFHELDQYHLHLTKAEAEARYADDIKVDDDRRRRGEFKTFRNVWTPINGTRLYGYASDLHKDQHGDRRIIAPSIEDAVRGRGPVFDDAQVSLVEPGDQWGKYENHSNDATGA